MNLLSKLSRKENLFEEAQHEVNRLVECACDGALEGTARNAAEHGGLVLKKGLEKFSKDQLEAFTKLVREKWVW